MPTKTKTETASVAPEVREVEQATQNKPMSTPNDNQHKAGCAGAHDYRDCDCGVTMQAALEQEKANREQIGAAVQAARASADDKWEPLRSKLTIREAQYLNEYAKTGDSVVLNYLVLGIIAQRDALQAQRDELLAVCKRLLNLSEHPFISGGDTLPAWAETQEQARAAIARATEGGKAR